MTREETVKELREARRRLCEWDKTRKPVNYAGRRRAWNLWHEAVLQFNEANGWTRST